MEVVESLSQFNSIVVCGLDHKCMSYNFTYRLYCTAQIFFRDKHIFTILKNMMLSICLIRECVMCCGLPQRWIWHLPVLYSLLMASFLLLNQCVDEKKKTSKNSALSKLKRFKEKNFQCWILGRLNWYYIPNAGSSIQWWYHITNYHILLPASERDQVQMSFKSEDQRVQFAAWLIQIKFPLKPYLLPKIYDAIRFGGYRANQ